MVNFYPIAYGLYSADCWSVKNFNYSVVTAFVIGQGSPMAGVAKTILMLSSWCIFIIIRQSMRRLMHKLIISYFWTNQNVNI